LIWVLAELAQQFRKAFCSPPFLFRRLLRLFRALAKLCFTQKCGVFLSSVLFGAFIRRRDPIPLRVKPSQP
jgi:hypothetical protein